MLFQRIKGGPGEITILLVLAATCVIDFKQPPVRSEEQLGPSTCLQKPVGGAVRLSNHGDCDRRALPLDLQNAREFLDHQN